MSNLTFPLSLLLGGGGTGTGDGSVVEEEVSTTTYTMVAADFDGKRKVYTNAAACLVTIPDGLGVAAGKTSEWRQAVGAGQVTFQATGPASITSIDGVLVSGGENSVGAVDVTGANGYLLVGQLKGTQVSFTVPVGDENTALTTGAGKITFRTPFPMTLTSLRASVKTAPTGAALIVDVNEGGTSLMTTNKLSIDATEKTSTTAATPHALTDTALADDAEITIDIDQIGSTIAGAGLKVTFYGYAL